MKETMMRNFPRRRLCVNLLVMACLGSARGFVSPTRSAVRKRIRGHQIHIEQTSSWLLPLQVTTRNSTSRSLQTIVNGDEIGRSHTTNQQKPWRRAMAVGLGMSLFFAFGRAAAASVSTTASSVATVAAETAIASPVTRTPSFWSRLVSGPLASALFELRLSIRLVFAALTGAAIGKERSGLKYHPAGVRTMSLVALGAALFTICSRHGFAGTHYDTSRMASNVASGVGFIGAGVIYHEQKTEVVHGLTTAAAIWISAAVGVACGAGLYVFATLSALSTLFILRVGGAVKFRRKDKRARMRKRHAESLQGKSKSQIYGPPVDKPSPTKLISIDDLKLLSVPPKDLPLKLNEDWIDLREDEETRKMLLRCLDLPKYSSNYTDDDSAP